MKKEKNIRRKPSKTKKMRKNVSLKHVADKIKTVIDSVIEKKKRKPFGGKGRKKKPTADDIRRAEAKERIREIEEETEREFGESSASSCGSSCGKNMSFFYTDDTFVTKFDDIDMLETIKTKFPKYADSTLSDNDMRKIVIDMLSDENFINGLLARYKMRIQDFFRFMFRHDPTIFKGSFLRRVQCTIRGKSYVSGK